MRTRVPDSGSSANNTIGHSFSRQISNNKDDAEQASSGGSMSLKDHFLDLGYDYFDFEAPQRVGLRFYNLGIPEDAEITNAYIQFQVSEVDENTNSPAQF